MVSPEPVNSACRVQESNDDPPQADHDQSDTQEGPSPGTVALIGRQRKATVQARKSAPKEDDADAANGEDDAPNEEPD